MTLTNFIKLNDADVNQEVILCEEHLEKLCDLYTVDRVKLNKLREHRLKDFLKMKVQEQSMSSREELVSSDTKKFMNKEQTRRSSNAEDLAKTFINRSWWEYKESVDPIGIMPYSKIITMNHLALASIITVCVRIWLLKWYQENLIGSDEVLQQVSLTEEHAGPALRYMDNNQWTFNVDKDRKECSVKAVYGDTGINMWYQEYHVELKPTWYEKVFLNNLNGTQIDIAGKVVFVMDAEEEVINEPNLPGIKLFNAKVCYAIVPNNNNPDWAYSNRHNLTDDKKKELKDKTLYVKDIRIVRYKTTDSTYYATGKDKAWALRTCKAKLKKDMLKKMRII